MHRVVRRVRTWAVAAATLAVLVGVVAPYVYINVIQDDPPERLTLADLPVATTTTTQAAPAPAAVETAPASTSTTPTTAAASASATTSSTVLASRVLTTDAPAVTVPAAGVTGLDGTWTVASGSQAGYRVKEVLFGQDTEVVGRTTAVSGSMRLTGTTVATASFSVDLRSVSTDESRRDGQFHGRIMSTSQFPTASFTLTKPLALPSLPADLQQVSATATGTLTIHGQTRTTSLTLTARRNGQSIEVNGTVPVVFADYGIPDASFGPAVVEDHGEIEILLVLKR